MTSYQIISLDITVTSLEEKMQNRKILLNADEHLELNYLAINVKEDLINEDEEMLFK